MDLKTLERQTKGKHFHKKLPTGEGVTDAISSKIWGVLYPTNKKNRNIASHFVMSILDNNSSIQHRSYNKEIGKILKSTGRALEYFLIDYMQRNKTTRLVKQQPTKINHRKGTFEQDTEDKIDFITVVSLREKNTYKHIKSGIQLTTADDPQHKSRSSEQELKFYYKKNIVKTTDTKRMHIPRSYQTDIKGFLVINGILQKAIHQYKSKIFSSSFRKWRKDGFIYGGPTNYLPENIHIELQKVAKLYERSQYNMIEEYILSKKPQKTDTIQEYENCYIHIKHNPTSNEIIYEFFDKQGEGSYTFIASITYFLPTN